MEKTLECQTCHTKNYEDAHFCTMCGAPLTQEASLLRKQKKVTAKLELLNELINEVNDVATLKLLKTKVEKLSK
jgi:uncharacterized membrane protein YvbJ